MNRTKISDSFLCSHVICQSILVSEMTGAIVTQILDAGSMYCIDFKIARYERYYFGEQGKIPIKIGALMEAYHHRGDG